MNSSLDDGGPAHPVRLPTPDAPRINGDPPPTELNTGMSLRDHFAGLALQGLLASQVEASREQFAEYAYKAADAMLIARKKAGDHP